jgi:hypothetical protein
MDELVDFIPFVVENFVNAKIKILRFELEQFVKEDLEFSKSFRFCHSHISGLAVKVARLAEKRKLIYAQIRHKMFETLFNSTVVLAFTHRD